MVAICSFYFLCSKVVTIRHKCKKPAKNCVHLYMWSCYCKIEIHLRQKKVHYFLPLGRLSSAVTCTAHFHADRIQCQVAFKKSCTAFYLNSPGLQTPQRKDHVLHLNPLAPELTCCPAQRFIREKYLQLFTFHNPSKACHT